MLGQKIGLDKFKKTEIISSIFYNHKSMRLEINYREKTIKPQAWRPNYSYEIISRALTNTERKFKKYVETNENENTTIQNLCKVLVKEPRSKKEFKVIPAYLTFSQKGHTDGQ